jgi:hypothetical protein
MELKFFLNELPWWARLDSGLDWSKEERAVSGIIISFGCFFSLIPFSALYYFLKLIGIDKNNAALIGIILVLPSSIYLVKIIYRSMWREYYERAEKNAKKRLKDKF